MKIEVVYSPAARVIDRCEIDMPEGATVAAAIEASGLHARHAGLKSDALPCGVWGRACRADRPLVEGDRVEVYRPLVLDPKDARRDRGREQKQAQDAQRRARAGKLSGTGSA